MYRWTYFELESMFGKVSTEEIYVAQWYKIWHEDAEDFFKMF